MINSERRCSHRYELRVSWVFGSVNPPLKNGHQAESVKLSSRGGYVVTSHPVSASLPVRILIHMLKGISGEGADYSVFAGRVSHTEPKTVTNGSLGVGTDSLYKETE